MMRRVYIAGPMRGIADFNFPAFFEAEDLGRHLGFQVLNPARQDLEDAIAPLDPMIPLGSEMTRYFASRDLAMLCSLKAENGDAIALLPGWEKSRGAAAEFFAARWLGLRVLDARTFEPFSEPPNLADLRHGTSIYWWTSITRGEAEAAMSAG